MREITAFITEDGKLFDSAEEAEDHELKSSNDFVINEFLNSEFNRYKSGPQRVIAKTSILSWIKWNK